MIRPKVIQKRTIHNLIAGSPQICRTKRTMIPGYWLYNQIHPNKPFNAFQKRTKHVQKQLSEILERERERGGGGGGRETETETENSNTNSTNSKTLVYKGCSLGSVKNLTTNPC